MQLKREGLTPPKNQRNPGHFGPAVIGGSKPQEPTAAQLKLHPELAKLARPEVADGEYELEQAWAEIGADIFGPLVIGDSDPQKPTEHQLKMQPGLAKLHGLAEPGAPAQASTAPARAQVPVAKLEEYLEANPYILDGVIAAEFERKEGPRKAALRIFLAIEKGKGQPRADVVKRIEAGFKVAAAVAA
jgi:hypothetical protein